jgi:hypothetical protein
MGIEDGVCGEVDGVGITPGSDFCPTQATLVQNRPPAGPDPLQFLEHLFIPWPTSPKIDPMHMYDLSYVIYNFVEQNASLFYCSFFYRTKLCNYKET